jgi:type IV pilus assembly protein PilN
MHIAINLATRPYVDLGPALKRLRIAMAVLAVLSAGFLLGLRAFHQKAEQARAAEQSVQNRIDAIQRERLGFEATMHLPANTQLLAQASMLNQLFEEKSFSWTLAIEDLETVLPGGVQVTSIEPVRDVKTGIISVKLRVVGPRDRAVELVRNLEHSRAFLNPRIVGESSESSGGPAEKLEPISASNRVNFELLAEYNPASPAPRREARKPEAGQLAAAPTPAPQPLSRPMRPNFPAAQGSPQMRPQQRPPLPGAPGMQPGRVPYTGQAQSKPSPINPPGGPR